MTTPNAAARPMPSRAMDGKSCCDRHRPSHIRHSHTHAPPARHIDLEVRTLCTRGKRRQEAAPRRMRWTGCRTTSKSRAWPVHRAGLTEPGQRDAQANGTENMRRAQQTPTPPHRSDIEIRMPTTANERGTVPTREERRTGEPAQMDWPWRRLQTPRSHPSLVHPAYFVCPYRHTAAAHAKYRRVSKPGPQAPTPRDGPPSAQRETATWRCGSPAAGDGTPPLASSRRDPVSRASPSSQSWMPASHHGRSIPGPSARPGLHARPPSPMVSA
ncbi:hypothetical protein AcV7_002428 [Taiwanofungus camphoratus]|nr:hypothetical protein AcV7_002428 [Antrodia cinnamomea]